MVQAQARASAFLNKDRNCSPTRPLREWRLVGWNPPPSGWVKLNSDGSVRGGEYKASSGGIIRNMDGDWLSGYSWNIGACSIAKAELWGVVDGLHLAYEKGFRWTVGS